MKHLLIGLSLVAAVTGFCLWSASYVRGAVEETARLLEAAYEAAEADQFSQARAAVQAASDTWDRYAGYFGTVLRHDEIDPRRNRRRGGGVRPAASDGAGRRPGRISPRLRRAAGDPGPRAGYGAAGFCKPFLRYQKRCRK